MRPTTFYKSAIWGLTYLEITTLATATCAGSDEASTDPVVLRDKIAKLEAEISNCPVEPKPAVTAVKPDQTDIIVLQTTLQTLEITQKMCNDPSINPDAKK